jgi:hypothetical protein
MSAVNENMTVYRFKGVAKSKKDAEEKLIAAGIKL